MMNLDGEKHIELFVLSSVTRFPPVLFIVTLCLSQTMFVEDKWLNQLV